MIGSLEMEKSAFVSLLVPVCAVPLKHYFIFPSVSGARTVIMLALTLV
jgi:hypothetical protein